MKMELRTTNHELLKSNGELVVEGYVNKPGSLSQLLGTAKRFKEKIEPGAFKRAIEKRTREIEFLAEHDQKLVLASTRNGSLELREDEQGLFMSAKISPTSYGQDYFTLISDGLIQSMSFGFRAIKDSWKRENGINIRTVHELELFEVSAVKEPAYLQSVISARRINLIEDLDVPELEQQNLEEERGMDNMKKIEKRTSTEFADFLKDGETRDLQTTANGTSVIPENVAELVIKKMQETSPVFAQARKFPMNNGSLKVPYETTNAVATFVGEGSNLEEQSLGLNHVTLKQKRVGAATRLTKQLINEMAIDTEAYVADRLARGLAKEVEKAILVNGGGADADNFSGSIKHAAGIVEVDLGAGIDTAISMDTLVDMYNSLHPDFLDGSEFIMSRPFFNKVAKLKDANEQYYLQNGIVNGKVTYTLLGAPVRVSDAMEAGSAVDEHPVFFGNMSEAYAIGLRGEQSIQRISGDTTQALAGTVLIVGDMYLDGTVVNAQAIVRGKVTA
ncbi:phage major capsid protein [Bacillus pseudomycoides]|uniref:phage major capsid protein n=1 Tax=Bacillus TaxID=1386 RepID=UPI002248A7B0|nr:MULTISPECIES: phage major capsid protein [Bacillus]MCX2828365.1 phage major capsid protein [Bacillus sp. DHT2]MDR4915047.1 phage major capsid protein [Bacillus pseudomycoides]